MIIGDVMTAVAIVVFSGLSLWAASVLAAVIFAARVNRCSVAITEHFWKSLLMGVLVGTPTVFVGLSLMAHPVGRIFGVLVLACIVVLALMGSSGLVRAVADRVYAAGGAKSDYEALSKAGLLVVLFAFLPFFGWLIVMPLILVASIGAGVKAFSRSPKRNEATEAA